jgi:hypothetical protein
MSLSKLSSHQRILDKQVLNLLSFLEFTHFSVFAGFISGKLGIKES